MKKISLAFLALVLLTGIIGNSALAAPSSSQTKANANRAYSLYKNAMKAKTKKTVKKTKTTNKKATKKVANTKTKKVATTKKPVTKK